MQTEIQIQLHKEVKKQLTPHSKDEAELWNKSSKLLPSVQFDF